MSLLLASDEYEIKKSKRNKNTPFSKEEVSFLIEGVKNFGHGHWTKILSMYDFNPKRKSSDVMVLNIDLQLE